MLPMSIIKGIGVGIPVPNMHSIKVSLGSKYPSSPIFRTHKKVRNANTNDPTSLNSCVFFFAIIVVSFIVF